MTPKLAYNIFLITGTPMGESESVLVSRSPRKEEL